MIEENIVYDAFLSYDWSIKQEIKILEEKLTHMGLKLWRDEKGQHADENCLLGEIAQAITKSKTFACFITKAYCESHNCNLEIEFANALAKPFVVLMIERLDLGQEIKINGRLDSNSGVPVIINRCTQINCYEYGNNWPNKKLEEIHNSIVENCKIRRCSSSSSSIIHLFRPKLNKINPAQPTKPLENKGNRLFKYSFKRNFYLTLTYEEGSISMEVAHSLNTVTSFYTHPFSRPQETPLKKEANFKLIQKFNDPNGSITSLVALKNDYIASSSIGDFAIKLWLRTSSNNPRKLLGHTANVTCLVALNEGQLVASGSRDKTIKIWDIISGNCIRTMVHLSWVLCLAEINEFCLSSGSADNLIKIWNVSNCESIRTIKGHSDWVTCLVWIRKKETILASGSKDNTIKLWNTQTGDLIRTLVGHFNSVLSLIILNNGLLASSSADLSIKLWNYTDNGKDIKTLQSKSKANRIQILNNSYLASGHEDGSIKIWDTNNGSLCRKIEGSTGLCDLFCCDLIRPSSVLNLVVLENGFLVSSHSNGCIKIRDACYEI